MRKASYLQVLLTLIVVLTTLLSCQNIQSEPAPTQTAALVTQPTRAQQTPTAITPTTTTTTATSTAQVTKTPTKPSPSNTPSTTPTPTWVYNEPGQVVAPILLYHHVDGADSPSRYRVPIADFRAQMQALHDNGYTAISISMLLDALIYGGELPEKPVVITFDDGHRSVYENAFPIMNEFGYPGVFYIVANRIQDVSGFVNVAELGEMIEAGWEVGSHGYTHADVTRNPDTIYFEIAQSKNDLEAALSTEILTFAYPYGIVNAYAAEKVNEFGYQAGLGLGKSVTHTLNNLLYLHRVEVRSKYTLDDFLQRIQPE